MGFWAACCQATFSYLGVEIIGFAAYETEQQRETLPRAVRRVSYRIVLYYVAAIFILGLNVSTQDPVLEPQSGTEINYSPFVLMVQRAGISGLDHVINAVVLIASVSVANTRLYVCVYTFSFSFINNRIGIYGLWL